MSARTLFACAVTAILLGCTTQLPGTTAATIPPANPFRTLTLKASAERPDLEAAQVCLVSTSRSCMELDSRPFEPCLVASKTCSQKDGEIMRVSPPALVDPPRAESR